MSTMRSSGLVTASEVPSLDAPSRPSSTFVAADVSQTAASAET